MSKTILSWIFSGGFVGIPKRLLAMLDLFQLDFEFLGKLVYLFYLEGQVHEKDIKGNEAAISLHHLKLIDFDEKSGKVDFSPLFEQLTSVSNHAIKDGVKKDSPNETIADLIKQLEKDNGQFLSLKDKQDLASVRERYDWSNEFLYKIFSSYKQKRNLSYNFIFFAKMLHGAGVTDEDSLSDYLKTLDYETNKVREILRRLGKYHNPTVSQEEIYHKWAREWKFSHEMIVLASDKTINANNPSFGYIDAILKEWYENGIKSKEGVEEYYSFYQKNKHKQEKNTSKVRYVNSSGYRDFSDLVE